MMAGEYSVREIDAKLAVISDTLDRMEADTSEKLKSIETQTLLTNGRVSKLERRESFIQGGLAVLTIIVVPTAIYIVTHWPQ